MEIVRETSTGTINALTPTETIYEDGPYLELNFRPNVDLINVARQFVSEFYLKMLSDPDASSRLALATHELLENAVKYSIDGATVLRVEVRYGPNDSLIAVRTHNRANPQQAELLRQAFVEMHAAPDAFAYYQTLMVRNRKRTDGSGLGLARIFAEAEMAMSCEIHDDQVNVFAQAPVDVRRIP